MENINVFDIPNRPKGDILYNFKIIKFQDLASFPDGLKDISERRLDGFLVKNVLSEAEVDTILANRKKLSEIFLKPNPSGSTYPAPFAIARNEETVEEYLNGGDYFLQNAKNILGVDIVSKIENVFHTISGKRKILVPPGNRENSHFTPATIRTLKPAFGGIHLHSGNYFQKEFPSFFDFLSHEICFQDQLSYFIMLNPPDLAGELTIYDLEWRDAQTKSSLYENKTILKNDGTILTVDDVKRMYLSPGKGDMIMFAGGPIWHRVEDILGEQSRITIGGFMAFSHDDKKIYYWA